MIELPLFHICLGAVYGAVCSWGVGHDTIRAITKHWAYTTRIRSKESPCNLPGTGASCTINLMALPQPDMTIVGQ